MIIRNPVAQAVRLALFTGAIAAWAPAMADTAPTEMAAVEEVVVTGSRIQGVTNENNPSPISVATADQIAMTASTNVEDILARMIGPDFTSGITNASNNGGDGLSVVGLRNLGPARTLILVDGQRLISTYSGTTEVTDLSSVPVSMIERVEVLRDGASSIYGADAIGGVINIITKRHGEGATFDGTFGESGHSDGKTKDLAGSVGVNSDKGNIMVAVSWDKSDPIQQYDRSWAIDPHLGGPGEGGSAYRSQLDTLQDENSSNIWVNGLQTTIHDRTVAGSLPNDTFLTGGNKYKLDAGSPGWNYLTQGLDRKQISLNSHYDLSDYVTFVTSGFFTDRTAEGSLRPEPLLGDSIATSIFPGFFVPGFAPGYAAATAGGGYSPYGFAAFLTPDQYGPRRYESDSETYRIRAGFEGKFGNDFHWEAGFVDQHNTTISIVYNEGNFEHLAQITGLINCVDVPGGCTPVAPTHTSNYDPVANPVTTVVTSIPTVSPNWFNGPGGIFTPAQIAYLTWDNTDRRTSTERVSYADVNGGLFSLPAGEVKAALGVEHRDEFLSDTPDILVQEGWGPNQSTPTAGGYNASSIYAEVNAPILKDVFLAKSLTIDMSGRYDKYSTFGTATTYKFGVNYSPIEDVRFRGSISTGFRAPNVAELYGGTAVSDISASGDPCDTRAAGYNGNTNVGQGVLTAGSTCSKAVAGGAAVTNFASANNNQTDQQQQVLVGGNPGLSPEKSNDWGAGVVLTPSYVQGLSLAADYYNIRIANTVLTSGIVGATSVDTVLLGCYGPAQNQAYCDLIHRNSAGTIIQVDSIASNFGVARVTGIDYQLTYDTARAHLDMPIPGTLRFDLQLSQQYTNSQTNADGTISQYNGAFQYSIEGIEPRFKGIASLDYTVGPVTAHWDTRFIEHTVNFDGSAPAFGNEIGNYYYHAISAAYTLKDAGPLKSARVIVGVNNLFDKDPPFLTSDSICKCNSLGGPYDVIGRYFYGRVSLKF
jgi:iron complex outermembrane receptor protein